MRWCQIGRFRRWKEVLEVSLPQPLQQEPPFDQALQAQVQEGHPAIWQRQGLLLLRQRLGPPQVRLRHHPWWLRLNTLFVIYMQKWLQSEKNSMTTLMTCFEALRINKWNWNISWFLFALRVNQCWRSPWNLDLYLPYWLGSVGRFWLSGPRNMVRDIRDKGILFDFDNTWLCSPS